MKATIFALAAVTTVSAQTNTATTTSTERPKWTDVPNVYKTDPPRSCKVDADCKAPKAGVTAVCIKHMWAYNGQTDSGLGCWDQRLCNGTGAYDMFDGRKIQWFCTAAQKTAGEAEFKKSSGLGADLPIKTAAAAHFTTFKESCTKDADCTGAKQYCTRLYWEGTKDSAAGAKDAYFAYGSACYNWDKSDTCPSDVAFASENKNYKGTVWSYYNQFWCTTTKKAAAAAKAAADAKAAAAKPAATSANTLAGSVAASLAVAATLY